jgi:hypothetical protein
MALLLTLVTAINNRDSISRLRDPSQLSSTNTHHVPVIGPNTDNTAPFLNSLLAVLVRNHEVISALGPADKATSVVAVANADKKDSYFQQSDTQDFLLIDSGQSHLSHIDSWQYILSLRCGFFFF